MTYIVKTPRGEYKVDISSGDIRDYVLEREAITITKQDSDDFDIIDIMDSLPWTGSNGKMRKNVIDTVVVHHDAQYRPDRYNSFARYNAQARFHINKGWRHISYHYIIDNIGDIYQCLPETEVGYHSDNYNINRRSIAIKFDGNMETQELTPQQVTAYQKLMRWLTTKRPDLPVLLKGSQRAHRSIKSTACPGKNTLDIINNF